MFTSSYRLESDTLSPAARRAFFVRYAAPIRRRKPLAPSQCDHARCGAGGAYQNVRVRFGRTRTRIRAALFYATWLLALEKVV